MIQNLINCEDLRSIRTSVVLREVEVLYCMTMTTVNNVSSDVSNYTPPDHLRSVI